MQAALFHMNIYSSYESAGSNKIERKTESDCNPVWSAIHQAKPGGFRLEIPLPLKIMTRWLDDLEEKGLDSVSLGAKQIQLPSIRWTKRSR